MAKIVFKSTDEYISAQPEPIQVLLQDVRKAIRKAVPSAEETISYNIPTYKLHKQPVIYFAGWKKHYSLYPATGPLIAEFKEALARYKISRGTIQFSFTEPVPSKLIEGIAKFRLKEVTAGQSRKTSAPDG
ncbi:MAG TPA: DUF1801 domain-containing protein [Bryobacteraceae bacterium]|nr:DUF1801 domain-containing protein [Bryobacteraceae bacterium]